jgi:hypothetical protein
MVQVGGKTGEIFDAFYEFNVEPWQFHVTYDNAQFSEFGTIIPYKTSFTPQKCNIWIIQILPSSTRYPVTFTRPN